MITSISFGLLAVAIILLLLKINKVEKDLKDAKESGTKFKNQTELDISDIYDNLRELRVVTKDTNFKEQFKELNDKVLKLQFQINNPFKYNIGDKIDKVWIVTDREIKDFNHQHIMKAFFSPFGINDVDVNPSYFNEYTLTNIKTGNTKNIIDNNINI